MLLASLVAVLAVALGAALTAVSGARPTGLGLPSAVGGPALPVAAITVATMVLTMLRRDDPPAMLDAASATLFPFLLVGLTLAYAVGLRAVDDRAGRDLPLLLLLSLAASDSAALYVGRALGRHRLAPRLSPKKSVEGAVAGLLAAVLAAFVARWTFYTRLPALHCVVLGLLLGAAGIAGDLTESMVKRATGAKDSSTLLPGHGGLLDRADSLLFTAPVLYYYYFLFLAPP